MPVICRTSGMHGDNRASTCTHYMDMSRHSRVDTHRVASHACAANFVRDVIVTMDTRPAEYLAATARTRARLRKRRRAEPSSR